MNGGAVSYVTAQTVDTANRESSAVGSALLRERIAAYSVKDEASGCWVWKRSIDRLGYGRLRFGPSALGHTGAHRISYLAHLGAIPEGKVIDHICHNRACVNPEHLRAVSQAENMANGAHALKDTCKHGHPFDSANTLLTRDGRRCCRACADIRRAQFKERRGL